MAAGDKNIGKTTEKTIVPFFRGPALAEQRTNVVLFERMILTLLRDEVTRLSDVSNADVLEQFMSHFFDPLATEEERVAFMENFQKAPPKVVLGYARIPTEMPCIAVVLENEQEVDNALGDFMGESLEGEEGPYASYAGAVWESTYGLMVYANHADVCAYLYQMIKLIVFGAKAVLEQGGFSELRLSGTELAPLPEYEPEHLYVRTLHMTGRAMMTVPEYAPDPANFRVSVYARDVVVEGVRGGIKSSEDC